MSEQIYSNLVRIVSNIGMKVGNFDSNDCKMQGVRTKEKLFECRNKYFETFEKPFVE